MIMWSHLILQRYGRSLMMYSYVVRRTWKLFVRSSPCKARRWVGLSLYETILIDGAYLANSPDQLVMVDKGTMTR